MSESKKPQSSEPVTLAQLIDLFAQKEHVDRILSEKDKKVEADRASLERGLNEAKATTERALAEAKATSDKQQAEAKVAADERGLVLQGRIEKLESGGAPFADRLNDRTLQISEDVDKLKTDAVRIATLDQLRESQSNELRAAKRSIRNIAVAAGASLAASVLLAVILAFLRLK